MQLRWQSSDGREIEQPLGVGFCVSHLPSQLRESGADQYDRQPSLFRTVHRRNQDGQLGFLDVLQFVDENCQRRFRSLCGQTHLLEQCLKFVLKVPVVGEARFIVKTDLDVGERAILLIFDK